MKEDLLLLSYKLKIIEKVSMQEKLNI